MLLLVQQWGRVPWCSHSGADVDWKHNSTGGYEALRASLAASIIMPTALSLLDADSNVADVKRSWRLNRKGLCVKSFHTTLPIHSTYTHCKNQIFITEWGAAALSDTPWDPILILSWFLAARARQLNSRHFFSINFATSQCRPGNAVIRLSQCNKRISQSSSKLKVDS